MVACSKCRRAFGRTRYGAAKTIYDRWKRWSDKSVFIAMMDGLSAKGTERKTIMIDATYLKSCPEPVEGRTARHRAWG